MTKTDILNEIRRTAEANGGVPLGWRKFATETGVREPDWKGKLWARWSDAVREAGLAPNDLTQAYDKDYLLQQYAKLALQLGRLPAVADMRLSKRKGMPIPEYETFTKRFGGKPGLICKLLDYCHEQREYAGVLQMCEGYAPRPVNKPRECDSLEHGFVYLMKSGRFYKIGRSNAAGRREYELSIQLPERTTLVHQIRTDDAPGIEAYWHRRFSTKRRNGEWFSLDTADVSAFKRRKFM